MMPVVAMPLLRCRLTMMPIIRPIILDGKPAYGIGQRKMLRTPITKDTASKYSPDCDFWKNYTPMRSLIPATCSDSNKTKNRH